ncbi:MAG TPA: class I SAM-dependent methyltransferase [Bryobacteraceae bacterium]
MSESQSFSVKQAQVEFHNFASLGQPERNLRIYAEENERRRGVIHRHREFIGPMTPFLEIGANAGHSSYMLANEFGASGFALDISADSLRHGRVLMDAWGLTREPVRLAGDAVNLPFADASLRFVCAFQMLSQFMDIESVFREVTRVLEPGGVFLFAEEPLLRKLSLRLYRCAYYDAMRPWERRLYDWGLLGYLVRDVIGAHQEESFGIRQNHSMDLKQWHALVRKHFAASEFEVFVPERGWGERGMKRLAIALDPHRSEWHAARLLGGTLAGVCRKAGDPPDPPDAREFDELQFEALLRCPDCHSAMVRGGNDILACIRCQYRASNEEQVYNLLPSAERRELYPGEREDIIDFSVPGHESHLIEGWSDLEGVFGNKYRWIGAKASARLRRVKAGPQRLRIRGFASPQGIPGEVRATVNGILAGLWKLDRPGLFVLEADIGIEGDDYLIEIEGSPVWSVPSDDRIFTVNLSMIRLVKPED